MKNAFIFAVAFATVAFAANKFGGVGLAVSSETYGLRVNAVVDGSPAAEAGVQENDLILSVDGISLFEQSLQYSIALLRDVENKPVELFVDRNGEELTFLMRRVEMEIDGQKGELMDSLYINDSIHVVRKIVKMDSVTKKKVHDKAPLDVEIVSMDKKEIIFDIRSSGLLKVNFVPANGDNQYKIYEENVYAGLGKIHLHGKKKPQGVFYIVFEQSGKIKSFSPSF